MTHWVDGRVFQVQHWTDNLFSLQIEATVAPFVAGQFTKISLEVNGIRLQRAYSYVNAPQNPLLEFYLVLVPDGQLSESLYRLRAGDKLQVAKQASGFFVLSEIPDCDTLWMVATGTAIGPYLSILQESNGLDRFRQIVLIHAVRYARDLSYWPTMQKLQEQYAGRLKLQRIMSRETLQGALHGRIPKLISSGELEAAVDSQLSAARSHVMLCGNPQMIRETQQLLKEERGMEKHLRRQAGQVSTEHYW